VCFGKLLFESSEPKFCLRGVKELKDLQSSGKRFVEEHF